MLQAEGWLQRLLTAAVGVRGSGAEELPRVVLGLAITLRLLATPEVQVGCWGLWLRAARAYEHNATLARTHAYASMKKHACQQDTVRVLACPSATCRAATFRWPSPGASGCVRMESSTASAFWCVVKQRRVWLGFRTLLKVVRYQLTIGHVSVSLAVCG